MICKSCGAEYNKKLLLCPYCQSENNAEAQRQKKRILREYDREAENIRKEAESYVKTASGKWTRRILIGIGIGLAAGVVLILLYMSFSRLITKLEFQGEETHLAKLEAYYAAGEYGTIAQYIRDENLYDTCYTKYDQIRRTYDALVDMEECEAFMYEMNSRTGQSEEELRKHFDYWAESYLKAARKAVYDTDKYINDKAFLNNEAGLQILRDRALERLYAIGLTEEEIAELCFEEEYDELYLQERLYELVTP